MSKFSKEFEGLLPPQEHRPPTAFNGPAQPYSIIRDQLQISTWLCLGAIVQGTALYFLGVLSLVPAGLLLLFRTLDTLLMTLRWKHNKSMDGVIMNKFTAQFPDDEGRYGSKPADSDVVVFIIGTRCNHPLGLLAPGFSNVNQYFGSMEKDLNKYGDEFGMLGMRICLDAAERTTGSEIVVICYFRDIEGLHAFAHSPYHRNGWEWYNRHSKQYPHISIFHETYHVPKGNWENIYAYSHASGITSTTHKYFDQGLGTEMWASPIVDASKGLLKTSAGRMSRSEAKEHDTYGDAP